MASHFNITTKAREMAKQEVKHFSSHAPLPLPISAIATFSQGNVLPPGLLGGLEKRLLSLFPQPMLHHKPLPAGAGRHRAIPTAIARHPDRDCQASQQHSRDSAGAVAAYLQLRGGGTKDGDRRVPSPASLHRGASPPSAPLSSGPSGGKPSGRGLWVQTVPAPLTQECREQQGGLCAAPAPSQCPQPGPPPAPAPRFPPCFFLVLFAGAAAHKNVPRQHKRPQRAKFLSAVGKEETGAVVYREVGRFSPRSPFSPPCRRCMTANSPPGLPLDLFLFFLSFFL